MAYEDIEAGAEVLREAEIKGDQAEELIRGLFADQASEAVVPMGIGAALLVLVGILVKGIKATAKKSAAA